MLYDIGQRIRTGEYSDNRYVSEISGSGLKTQVETTLEEVEGRARMTVSSSGTYTSPVTWTMVLFLWGRIAR